MITNTQELKAAVGGAVNASFSFSSIEHAVPTIIEEYLVPAFGEDLYLLIEAEPVGTTALGQVRAHCVRALAWLLLSDYAEVGAVQMNSVGIVRIEGENARSAYRYQEERYRTSVRVKGHDFIEKALYTLHTHVDQLTAPQLTAFTDSPAEGAIRGALVCFSKVVEQEHGMKTDFLTFKTLQPLLRELEENAVLPMLGTATYTQLMAKVRTSDIPAIRLTFGNDEWSTLANMLRRAMVLAAVSEAQRRFLVSVSDGRVTLRQQSGDQADVQTTTPAAALASISHEHLREFKDIALASARQYLESLPLIFTDYATEHADDDQEPFEPVRDFGGIVRL